jgi:outer membrane lipoprotein LolB
MVKLSSMVIKSMNTQKSSLIILLLCSLMSSCASLNKNADSNNRLYDGLDGVAAELLNKHWRVNGKLAIRTLSPSGGSSSAQALRFDWQQQAQDYNVTLSGPLGFGRVTVTQQNQRIYLSQGSLSQGSLSKDKNAIEANDIDQLFAQQTGWALPISYLRYWALGLPAPEQAFTLNKNSQAQLIGFKQDGWQINYPSITLAAPYPLPSKMIASNKHFTLVIAFKHWQFPLIQPDSSVDHAQ